MKIKKKRKTKELAEKRKKQILDAAIKVFAQYGFVRANTEEIARKTGVGKGTIYRYFKNKKNLFLSVVDRGLDNLRDKIFKETEKVTEPLLKIEKAVRMYLSFFEKNKDFVAILIHEQSSFQKRIAKRYFEHYYGNINRIKKTFKAGIEQGLIKDMDIESAIGVLTSILNGLIYRWQIEGRRYKLSEKALIVLKIFFTGIIKDKKRKKQYE